MLLITFLLLSYLGLSVRAAAEDSIYPSCGDCWCSPDNNGLGPCPIWEPRSNFSSTIIDTYASQVPISIYEINCNPYEDDTCTTTPKQLYTNVETAVCAFKYPVTAEGVSSCSAYEMITYTTREEAEKDGGVVTHAGSCGLCSTAKDLSIYLAQDFTTAGKICATKGLFNEAAGLQCYMDLGLTEECAKIWNFDGIYDGSTCGKICAGDLSAPNNGPPPACELNECLQCDEDYAGPIFSSFGGRTRRRSGLKSEIIRPCSSVYRIFEHNPCANPECGC